MANVELILLEQVEHLGKMGARVKVKPGYARNYLLPKKKAVRATKDSLAKFEEERLQLEAQNEKRRAEAERVAERVDGMSVVLIRQSSDAGSLFGSVSPRDIAEAASSSGLVLTRQQVLLNQPIKMLGLHPVRVMLHPEVTVTVQVNVARSPEEAERQARGEQAPTDADDAPIHDLAKMDQPDVVGLY